MHFKKKNPFDNPIIIVLTDIFCTVILLVDPDKLNSTNYFQ